MTNESDQGKYLFRSYSESLNFFKQFTVFHGIYKHDEEVLTNISYIKHNLITFLKNKNFSLRKNIYLQISLLSDQLHIWKVPAFDSEVVSVSTSGIYWDYSSF
jgi:hypothetical protein